MWPPHCTDEVFKPHADARVRALREKAIVAHSKFVLGLLAPLSLAGCLSNSYYVERDELARLSALGPEERWQSVRATQRIGGEDDPPTPEWYPEPRPVYASTVVIESHPHPHPYYASPLPPPPRSSSRPPSG